MFLNELVSYGILSSESVEDVFLMKIHAMLSGNCCAICGYAESSVEEDVSPTRTTTKIIHMYVMSVSSQRRPHWRRTELPLRERLEQLQQAVLPRLQDLARLRQVDRAHLQRAQGEVAEQVVHIRPRQLQRGRRVVVECRPGEALGPLREELWDAGHVHVGLDERVVQTLVGDVHLGDPEDVVDVRDD